MPVTMYAGVRIAAAERGFSWALDDINASIVSEAYLPDLELDRSIATLPPFYATIPLVTKVLSEGGWWRCDRLYFPPVLIEAPFSAVVIWRVSDALPLLHVSFPVVLGAAIPRPFYLLFGRSKPGIARL